MNEQAEAEQSLINSEDVVDITIEKKVFRPFLPILLISATDRTLSDNLSLSSRFKYIVSQVETLMNYQLLLYATVYNSGYYSTLHATIELTNYLVHKHYVIR